MIDVTAPTTTERSDESAPAPLATRLLLLDWEKVAYVAIIVIALVTRLWAVGDRVMSHDESLHTQYSLQYYRGEGYRHTPLMHGPFLFHITALTYWLFGASDFSSRLPVALFGVVLVALPFFLRPWLGRFGALATSVLFLISPYITYYSRYIRHDIYVITWAFIIFIATWYYLRHSQERHLWWFAGALALLFATKEVSFIYVAIFGSFLVIRLVVRLWQEGWFHQALRRLRNPALILAISLLLVGVGFFGLRLQGDQPAAVTPATETTEAEQGFAADPDATPAVAAEPEAAGRLTPLLRWLQVAGVLGVGLAAVLAAQQLRPHIDRFPEFDLILLYSTLVLPLTSPFLMVLAGINPIDYSVTTCEIASGTAPLRAAFVRFLCLADSNIMRIAVFVIVTLVIAVAVGLWWNRRRWIIAAAIFHSIFFLLYTSVFTNPPGWASGTVGSLGYWLEQQEVQRGSQPWFYYFFVTPFYEFLPLILSLLAIRLWAKRQRLSAILSYWVTLILGSLLLYSFSRWLVNRPVVAAGEQPESLVALLLAFLLFAAGAAYWFVVRRPRLREQYEPGTGWRGLIDPNELVGFVPSLIWWLLLTWVAYSVAGEKMPWLSTHFVIPSALLGGWYLHERIVDLEPGALRSRHFWLLTALVAIFLGTAVFALRPLIVGEFRLGDQELGSLTALGGFLGAVVVAALAYYLVRYASRDVPVPLRWRAWLYAPLLLLGLLTIRFTYMANWPNADLATEYMVYAHAAPAVKEAVMSRIDALSFRMHGDRSMRVAWGDDGTWPMQWYLKDYPNRVFVGATPSASITEFPVVVAGHRDLANFEAFLSGDDYVAEDYIFLWWPMEEYRHISWNALFGLRDIPDPATGSRATGRGILSAEVRKALWDIFFHRDYTAYGNAFGGNYSLGSWPLRAQLRLYVKRDVLANLWDYGATAVAVTPPFDPYAEGELLLTPNLVIGAGAEEDPGLLTPRNVAIGPEGNVYVLDTGNHRVAVFDEMGRIVNSWGGPGTEPSMFNEPWGIAIDEAFVYVADTWNHRIQKFTLDGGFLTTFGQLGMLADVGADSGGFFFGPRSIALLPDGRLAVTDTGNHRIQIFDRDGNFLRIVGSQGPQPGQLNEPVGLDSGAGQVFLADTWNARVQRFTEEFIPVLQWPIDGWEGESTENKPYLAVDDTGNVFVTDPENQRILIFDADGNYLGRFGQEGMTIDRFGLPNGIAVDDAGNVYIADARNNRVVRYPPPPLSGPVLPLDQGSFPGSAEDEEAP
jgi:predicted membrane-bound mannosyltransferase/DNA-binding beta-propeller fold protein YncE